MLVLFIPKWYPSRVHALNGNFIRRHALAVAIKHKVAVLFVSADPDMKSKVFDLEYEVDQGIETVKVFYNNSFPKFPFFSSLLLAYRYLKACAIGIRVINEKFGKPDLCHIHILARTYFIAWYYTRFCNVPMIISEQWSGYLPEDGAYKGFFKKMLTKLAIRKAAAVTTVSESLKGAMLSHGLKNRYSVIPNVVDTNLFFPSNESVQKDKFIFLHVSNLEDRAKNISGMIRSMKKLSEKRTDFEFQIVGDGPGRTELEALAKQLNLLNQCVFFLGSKTSSDVANLMKKTDLFLLFSNYDNMPCVMIESLASGLPVVGSAIHGINEHIHAGMGKLVPPGDENALCDALIHGMNNIGSFDKGKLHTYAKGNFSYEAVSEQFDEIYQKVIKN